MVLKNLNKPGFVSFDIEKKRQKQKQKRFFDDPSDLWSPEYAEEYGAQTTFVNPFIETLNLLDDK